MSDNAKETLDSIGEQEKTLTYLIQRIYREEAEATHDEITIALNNLVEKKSEELGRRNRELAKAYADLNLAHQELQQAQKLESLGRLAAGVAHEINTPAQYVGDSLQFVHEGLDDLLGYIGRLEALIVKNASQPSATADTTDRLAELRKTFDIDYLTENLPKSVARAADGVSRVTEIVKSMKTFSYPDQPTAAAYDLIEALKTTLAISKNEYKYFATIQTDYQEIPKVECLAGEINQVFLNLIVNAAHAIEEVNSCSGELGVITIRTRRAGDSVIVEFQDTGAGIPQEVRSRIFDPFFTTKEMGKGTGQGLAIARQVVQEKHGGELSFSTEVGKGTTFTIRLPICQPK